ncbi:glycoside hydrolase family 2 protein [Natronorubrum halophilum]|uniref:glycoside hydrolase family 2 n=1 Tax=Natronorubrum halophilum TaxID=1702106 RepID=UPI000EF6E82B|nr:glycoside hydrolase family 2 [Natronorubrum halophilum]
MGAKWTGGVVNRRGDDGPPTVEEWLPVSVPGRPAAFGDAAGPIAYRTTFGDPRSDAGERALVELRGIYARAEIWLNGDRLGAHDSTVLPFRAAFDPRPENELVVVCERPDPLTGIYGSDELPDEFATPAIRWGVGFESRPRTFLRRFEARSRLTEDGGVIDVEAEVDAGESTDDAITFSVRPEGFRGGGTMQRASVQAAAGERVTVSRTLEIREPSLWWPRGYGPQQRYAVRAKLGEESLERTVGFREIERDGEGILVNGTQVRARGFTRLPGGDPATDVERAVGANATLLRARTPVPPTFYDACDEAGVLVWQDLPTGGPNADRSLERTRLLAAALERTYGHHPSLAIYGGHDDPSRPFDGLYGGGFLTKLRFRYRARRTTADRPSTAAIAEVLPDDRPVVTSAGPPGTDSDAALIFPGWQYLEADAVEWLLERDRSIGPFVGGFGAGSLTAADVDPADIPGLDEAALEHWVGADPTVEASQTYQARTLKTVAEALRRRRSGVLVAATLRDATPGGGAGVLTRTGEEKEAYRALARSFEPVQAILDGPPEPGSVGITLCNDTHEEVETTVSWRAGEAGDETVVRVGPLETADAGTAEIPRTASGIELTVGGNDRAVTNQYHL